MSLSKTILNSSKLRLNQENFQVLLKNRAMGNKESTKKTTIKIDSMILLYFLSSLFVIYFMSSIC